MIMKHSISLFILSLIASFSMAQETDSIVEGSISRSFMPDNCFDSTFHIEKLEEITYHQIASKLAKEDMAPKKDRIIENAEFFNLVMVKERNQYFEQACADENKLNISTIYKGDYDKLPKYSIVSKYELNSTKRGLYDVLYAIYDNETDTRYAYFSSLDVLFAAIKQGRTYMSRSASRDQEDLDAYLDKRVPYLERKDGSQGGSGKFWWGLLIVGNIALLVAILSDL